jgi:mono/diheme cytochrome c family protein
LPAKVSVSTARLALPAAPLPRRSGARPVAIAVGVVLAIAAAGALVVLALAAHPSLPERPTEPPLAFDAATVQRGAGLAAIGNCASCHTAAFGAPYAGGVALPTPFGTIHGTNITPDRETGIGSWTETAFVRAMREGVARDGSQLYPAFPYDHFTHTSDDDLHALYAFVMSRDAVRRPNLANDLRFPFGLRPLVAGWNLLFLRRGPLAVADAARPAEWNRGAYLVQSLGHCGACHAPRNALGAEQRRRGFAGGEAEGWTVPALDASSPSPLPWTIEQLSAYLRTGIAADHAIAGGPMQEVVEALARAPAADVRAIAVYIESSLAAAAPQQQVRGSAAQSRAAQGALRNVHPNDRNAADAAALQLGAGVYEGACSTCHDRGRAVSSNGALRLPLAIAVHDPDPRSLLRIIREGVAPPPAEPGRFMPAFGTSLTDEQLVGLLVYLRATAADAPPWPDLAEQVRDSKAPR